METEFKNIADALEFIQQELKAPKKNENKHLQIRYRSAENILEALKPHLKTTGCIVTISDDVVLIGDRYYIKATVTLSKGSEMITTQAFARETETKVGMDASQITGAASSYARKYALNGMFAIDDTKDADTEEYTEKTTQKTEPQKTEPQKNAPELDAAIINAIRNAKTLDELLAIHTANKELQTDETFGARLSERKKQILNQKQNG